MVETIFSTQTNTFADEPQNFSESPATLPALTSLTGTSNAYYRSILFTIDHGLNSLISAAAPLLAIAGKLSQLMLPPDSTKLYQDLIHEIKAFENKAQSYNYRSHTVLAARYSLCALLDEIILNTGWGKNSIWHQQNLVNIFQPDDWGGEKFFLMLQRVCEEPALHIDLLELMYICLSLGYEGKYRNLERGYHQLNQISDELYKIIENQRGEFSKRLTINPTITKKSIKITSRLWPALTVMSLAFLLLMGVYWTLNYSLGKNADKLLQEFHQLQNSIFSGSSQ